MSSLPLVIYHAHCADGFTAAWIAHKGLGAAELHAASYYEDPPKVNDRDVFILDFHYDRETTIDIQTRASSLLVLDHHKTAAAALEWIDQCVFDMSKSGAMLAWECFFDGPAPWLVEYVQDRDLWQWKLPHSREVNAYIQQQKHELKTWDQMSVMDFEEAKRFGQIALQSIANYVSSTADITQVMEIDGHRVPVINAPPWHASELLNELCSYGYPFAISWYVRSDGQVGHSLRSKPMHGETESVDVSEIAKKYGGGGHREAAGFIADKPIFEIS